jgi:thioredoxin 1
MENVSSNLVKELQSQGNKILVSYSAAWCGPCRQLTPRLDEISKEYPEFKFLKVDIDQNRDAVNELFISSVPTVIIYDGDKIVDRSNGSKPSTYYKEILDKLK